MKIIFYLHSPTTYQFDFFRNLLKKGIEVFVIYQEKKIINFNWKFQNYKWVFFLNKNFPRNQIESILENINPHAVILGGYRMSYDKFFYLNKKYLLFYWLEKLEKKFFMINFFRYIYLKKKLKQIDGILAIGQQAKNYYKKFHHNVLNLPYSIQIEKLNIKKKKYNLNFLFVGQLIHRKGIHMLVKVLSSNQFNNVNFTICGLGPYKEKIEKIKRKNIKYLSFLSNNELSKIYKNNSILLVPSEFDGWAVVVIEAMAKGLVVISNNKVGAFKEYIKHGINGREIENNENSITRQINFFISNQNLIKKYGIKNYYKVNKELSNSKLAANELKKFIKKNYNNKCKL